MTPGFHSDLDEQTYHAHRGSLSHSGAKVILKAPALFRYQQDHPVHRDVFDFGTAAHALVLGKGMDKVYVAPYDDWTKRKGPEGGVKYTTDEKRIAQDDGLSPILPEQWLTVCDMADELSRHRKAMELLSDGEAEVSAFVPDEATGVLRRCRYDWLRDDIVPDYKTTVCSEPRDFVRSAAKFGYHSQHAWYLDVLRDLGRTARGFVFIAQEKTPPYLVTVIELPADLVDVGRERNRAALQRFRDCTESGLWPGYVSDDCIATAAAPAWAYNINDLETA